MQNQYRSREEKFTAQEAQTIIQLREKVRDLQGRVKDDQGKTTEERNQEMRAEIMKQLKRQPRVTQEEIDLAQRKINTLWAGSQFLEAYPGLFQEWWDTLSPTDQQRLTDD